MIEFFTKTIKFSKEILSLGVQTISFLGEILSFGVQAIDFPKELLSLGVQSIDSPRELFSFSPKLLSITAWWEGFRGHLRICKAPSKKSKCTLRNQINSADDLRIELGSVSAIVSNQGEGRWLTISMLLASSTGSVRLASIYSSLFESCPEVFSEHARVIL